MSFTRPLASASRPAVLAAILAAATFVPLAATPASAHDYEAGSLRIAHPWARATPPRAGVAGAYMVIENTGNEADRLLGGTTDAAEKVQVHSMTMDGGIMKMRQLKDGLTIPAGETVTLAPGGYHLMLINPVAPLKEGASVPATLTFEKAGAVKVELAVEGMGAEGPGATGGMHRDGAMTTNGEHSGHDQSGTN